MNLLAEDTRELPVVQLLSVDYSVVQAQKHAAGAPRQWEQPGG
ncbi:hypothetical protein [Humibacillus sp. DSM 29435]|nr:hypothetical protein [Humibacillus sp. DSM 29435]